MALIDEVKARYSSAFLINLTNPNDETASAIDDTVLAAVCTDVAADFEIFAGVAFDSSDSRHVTTAVDGVIHKLVVRTGHSDESAEVDRWERRLLALAKVTGRDRIAPATNSKLEPSQERRTGETVRPIFDDDRFDDLLLGAPPA